MWPRTQYARFLASFAAVSDLHHAFDADSGHQAAVHTSDVRLQSQVFKQSRVHSRPELHTVLDSLRVIQCACAHQAQRERASCRLCSPHSDPAAPKSFTRISKSSVPPSCPVLPSTLQLVCSRFPGRFLASAPSSAGSGRCRRHRDLA